MGGCMLFMQHSKRARSLVPKYRVKAEDRRGMGSLLVKRPGSCWAQSRKYRVAFIATTEVQFNTHYRRSQLGIHTYAHTSCRKEKESHLRESLSKIRRVNEKSCCGARRRRSIAHLVRILLVEWAFFFFGASIFRSIFESFKQCSAVFGTKHLRFSNEIKTLTYLIFTNFSTRTFRELFDPPTEMFVKNSAYSPNFSRKARPPNLSTRTFRLESFDSTFSNRTFRPTHRKNNFEQQISQTDFLLCRHSHSH